MNNPFGHSGSPSFMNSVLGMVIMIAGSIVMNIGARGAAVVEALTMRMQNSARAVEKSYKR